MKYAVLDRRRFLKAMALAGGGIAASLGELPSWAAEGRTFTEADLIKLPTGNAPAPVSFPHFPSRLHAFVWRNWQLVPVERLASVVGAQRGDILALARRMGLRKPPRITRDQQRRSYITVIKRNWHLLPYAQLLTLLDWTPEELAFTLREDDFLYIKLGSLKPRCAPLKFTPSDDATRQRETEIARFVEAQFHKELPVKQEPLFEFVRQLSAGVSSAKQRPPASNQLRFCYSYFALYGDPLLDTETDAYPDGYLARLAATGVNGVWLQAVLHKLAPCPWQPERSARHEERLKNLHKLAARAARHGVKIFLYLNEPRALPLNFFDARPELKGAVQGDYAMLCTSQPAVRKFLTESVERICRAVPELGGFFTITASENPTNCWSHGAGKSCPRCRDRTAAEVIAEVNGAFAEGIQRTGDKQRLLAWDWGWADAWAGDVIRRLPKTVSLMSVSEWSLPIERGGVKSAVGEYSISSVGPGPRAKRHWTLARENGLSVIAKIQAGNTWELSALPYIPALSLVAQHAKNLRAEKVDGLMLGWTLGGYPSPNLETVGEVLAGGELATVAKRRFGDRLAPAVLKAWTECSEAFREFPYDIGVVYSAPQQNGPSNLLWEKPTGYRSTMVGFPYDDIDGWRAIYPAPVFIAQLEKVAGGFASAAKNFEDALKTGPAPLRSAELFAADYEQRLMRAASLHWQSVASQSRFVVARRALAAAKTLADAEPKLEELTRLLRAELKAARELHDLQVRDSRLGFEASNQYYYVPMDLVEKMLNCQDLLNRWLPAERQRLSKTSA